jgi:hypothetical protein
MRWKVLLTIGLAVSLWAGVAVWAQKVATKATGLTAADYIEIQQLAARSSYAIDSGANGGELFADLFAPEGAFISASRGRIEGHDNLVALGRGRNPMYPRRFIVNHVIEPTADGATGKVYVLEVDLPTEGKVGGELTSTGGRYEDEYEKTPMGWRFKTRKFVRSKVEVPGAPRTPPAPSGAAK